MKLNVLHDLSRMRWQLCTGQQLRTLTGDDEAVIYNDRSGETHLLRAIALTVLQQLRVAPADFLTLSASLARDWEFESDSELQHVAMELLDELDTLGLIEPHPF